MRVANASTQTKNRVCFGFKAHKCNKKIEGYKLDKKVFDDRTVYRIFEQIISDGRMTDI